MNGLFCENRRGVSLRRARRAQSRHICFEHFDTPGPRLKADYMADLFNLVMLVCAAIGSMAFGVLGAYGIFRVGFAMMRPRRKAVPVKTQPEAVTLL